MCFVIPPIVAGIMAAVGAATAATGAIVQGVGAANAGAAADEAAQRNAQLAKTAQAQALARGSKTAGDIRTRGSQIVGKQRSAYGASGVDATNGSAAQLYGSTMMVSELDAQMAKSNAAMEAWGFGRQASDLIRQGEQARSAGMQQMAGSFLSGAGKLATDIHGISSNYRAELRAEEAAKRTPLGK